LPHLRSKVLLLLFGTVLASLALVSSARTASAVSCLPENYRDHCKLYYSDAAKTHYVCGDCCGTLCNPTPYYTDIIACCT
jgi:hypothetical protein